MSITIDRPDVLQDEACRIVEYSPQLESAWDDFVTAQPDGNMYQLSGWKEVLQETFGFQPRWFAAVDESGALAGVLPTFLMRDIFGKKYLISNPFSNFCGICARSEAAERKLLARAVALASSERVEYLELRQLRHRVRVNGDTLACRENFVTPMLNLESGSDAIWNGLSSRNRGKVRKARKSGLTIDCDPRYLSEFYDVWTKNLRRLGTPVYPIGFFRNVLKAFPDHANLLVLKKENRVVAGMFLFAFGDTMSEPWVSSLTEYNRVYVNNLLYWTAIEKACAEGFKMFDFGRSTDGTGTFNFKTQWGAEPVQLYYEYYLNKARQVPVADANENKYDAIINLWKRLPLAVANFIGPRVVRYLPEL